MKIDTDIVLWNGNGRKKYRTIITVEATTPMMMADGSKEDRTVENHSTLQALLNEFISEYNKKANEKYLFELQGGQKNPTQIGCAK